VYCETESEDVYNKVHAQISAALGLRPALSPQKNLHANSRQDDSWENPIPESATSWIGSDECGKGDYFGPLVTAAVMVDAESILLLQELNVRDSKDISDNEIQSLASHIRVICDGKFSIVTTMPERYNELMESELCKGNSLWLLGWQHAKAIENIVVNHPEVRYALIDKFSNEKFVRNALSDAGKKITLIFRHKAENNIAVAAASILAREEFLRRLRDLEKIIGTHLPKGASGIVDAAGRKLVALKGEKALRLVAKVHFKTTKKVTR